MDDKEREAEKMEMRLKELRLRIIAVEEEFDRAEHRFTELRKSQLYADVRRLEGEKKHLTEIIEKLKEEAPHIRRRIRQMRNMRSLLDKVIPWADNLVHARSCDNCDRKGFRSCAPNPNTGCCGEWRLKV